MTSDVMGSGPGWTPPVTIETRVSGIVVTFCLFFGCGSTVEESRFLDRTGTGIVARGLPRPGSVIDGLPGVGSGPGSVMRAGFRPCVMGCPHVTPLLVKVTMEVKEQRCGGLLMSDGLSENVKKAWNLPTQWTARRKGEAPPGGLDA